MTVGRKTRFERIRTYRTIEPEVPTDLPWLIEAAHLYDAESKAHSPGRRLVRAVESVAGATGLNLPWCGLFVGHCLRATLPPEPFPWFWFRARPWRHYGEDAKPQLGAVLLFWLRWPTSPFGHVGFYWGEDDDTYHVLGGNQHASILIERFPKSRLIDCRWPVGVQQPGKRRQRPAERAAPFEYA